MKSALLALLPANAAFVRARIRALWYAAMAATILRCNFATGLSPPPVPLLLATCVPHRSQRRFDQGGDAHALCGAGRRRQLGMPASLIPTVEPGPATSLSRSASLQERSQEEQERADQQQRRHALRV